MKTWIEVDPNVPFGRPCVAGTRIPVQDVLATIGEEIPFEQIIQDYYSDLAQDDVRACTRSMCLRRKISAGSERSSVGDDFCDYGTTWVAG